MLARLRRVVPDPAETPRRGTRRSSSGSAAMRARRAGYRSRPSCVHSSSHDWWFTPAARKRVSPTGTPTSSARSCASSTRCGTGRGRQVGGDDVQPPHVHRHRVRVVQDDGPGGDVAHVRRGADRNGKVRRARTTPHPGRVTDGLPQAVPRRDLQVPRRWPRSATAPCPRRSRCPRAPAGVGGGGTDTLLRGRRRVVRRPAGRCRRRPAVAARRRRTGRGRGRGRRTGRGRRRAAG